MWKLWFKISFSSLLFFGLSSLSHAWVQGIYLTQYTAEAPAKLKYLLSESKATGINTFVIDHDYYSSHYAPTIAKIKSAGIKVVARIVVFSNGGNAQQIHSEEHREKILKLVNDAIKAGVDVIQLDYIRYSSKQPANPQHAKDIHQVIAWFKQRINAQKIPMEIDIFGEVSYYPSMHIGQDLKMFADSVDGVNPMVYPSHFWPYQKYSAEPYKTINNSLNALTGQFNHHTPFKVHAFIEATNFHYIAKTTNSQKQKYLLREIQAVQDAKNVAGWYVWSANNEYKNLFTVLRENKIKATNVNDVETIQKAENNNPSSDISNTPADVKPVEISDAKLIASENQNASPHKNNIEEAQKAEKSNPTPPKEIKKIPSQTAEENTIKENAIQENKIRAGIHIPY